VIAKTEVTAANKDEVSPRYPNTGGSPPQALGDTTVGIGSLQLRGERLPPHRLKLCHQYGIANGNHNLRQQSGRIAIVFPIARGWISNFNFACAPIPVCPRPIGIWVDRARLKNRKAAYAAYRSNDGT